MLLARNLFVRRRRRLLLVATVILAVVAILLSASARVAGAVQEDEPILRLRMRRDFGYGSGAQIQGRFSLLVDEHADLERVAFYIDDVLMGEDEEAPFRLQFNTSSYELGWHSLHAEGTTTDARQLSTNTIQRQFVSGSTSTYIIIAAVVLLLAFRVISHLVTRDRSPGSRPVYGIYGGAICPRCGRPFSRHWWAPNLLLGKLDRCPHCGKWHFSTRASPQMLQSAERFADELAAEQEPDVRGGDDEEMLRKRLDESRFDD